jgi:hypothetical protein
MDLQSTLDRLLMAWPVISARCTNERRGDGSPQPLSFSVEHESRPSGQPWCTRVAGSAKRPVVSASLSTRRERTGPVFARAFTIAIALLLAACAQPVATEKLSSIHNVRVVSLVGDPVTVQAIGFTVFGNEERLIPAASWRIDDEAAARVGRAGSPREMRPADATKWADVTEALTPEQAQRLAAELKQLMSESLPKTLGDLNLR